MEILALLYAFIWKGIYSIHKNDFLGKPSKDFDTKKDFIEFEHARQTRSE